MANSWFEHTGLTLAEALAHEKEYQKRGRRTERELVGHLWTLRVWLPEYRTLPRSRIVGSKMWGLI